MKELQNTLSTAAGEALQKLYDIEDPAVELQPTRKEFEGDFTLVVFPYLRMSKKKPEDTAREVGELMLQNCPELASFNIVKGFLNLIIRDEKLLEQLPQSGGNLPSPENKAKVLVEYSSPNTNKPLHLGHIRNNLLGYSVAEILKAAGREVKKVQIINDRGIHICKSMVAWKKFGQGETPESSGIKGDHLVGKYYVAFDKAYKEEIQNLQEQGHSEEEAKDKAPLMQEARVMLQKWEENDPDTVALWQQMNSWVYAGFEKTYQRLGVDFDKNYYESETYLLGRQEVLDGLEKGVFFQKEDGSVWCDLSEEKLNEKLLLRRDGTSVYMTQDIGTAIQRYRDFGMQGMIYTVGNEQDHHFKVLFAILKKLGYDWAHHLYHLSYGMVDLPSGKMKSREGTVVDADDLVDQMKTTARDISEELGKTEGMNPQEKEDLYEMVGLGALKYFILKVDPRKRMLFNPEESVDFQGNTGPFIQYTHARICSLLRKAGELPQLTSYPALQDQERAVVKHLLSFPQMVQQAALDYAPSVIASYVYDLVKAYNTLYQQLPILTDQDEKVVALRLRLSQLTAETIEKAMHLLGIQVPRRM